MERRDGTQQSRNERSIRNIRTRAQATSFPWFCHRWAHLSLKTLFHLTAPPFPPQKKPTYCCKKGTFRKARGDGEQREKSRAVKWCSIAAESQRRGSSPQSTARHMEWWTRQEVVIRTNSLRFLIFLQPNKSMALNTSAGRRAPDWQEKWSWAAGRDSSSSLFRLSSPWAHKQGRWGGCSKRRPLGGPCLLAGHHPACWLGPRSLPCSGRQQQPHHSPLALQMLHQY